MIKLYINGELRDDVWIQAGGTLEQTEEHTTESNISVKVPIESDNLAVYDYVQIYDDDTIIFAGNILSLNQQMLDSGYTGLDFRVYDLVLACNADLVANILVDMSFPAGATITQILKGNHEGDAWYDADLGEFAGIIEFKIVPEGVTVGDVDNYDATALEGTSYLWGETVKNLLDNLAELTQSYWEITHEKIFNFRKKVRSLQAPFNLTKNSNIFNLEVENDSLATYSAVRVIGGEGEVEIDSTYYPSDRFTVVSGDTIESAYSLLRIRSINVKNVSSGTDVYVEVGYEGVDDENPSKDALISYKGSTIKLKNGYEFYQTGEHAIYSCKVLQKITARIVSETAAKRIQAARGGTGLIEYILEDESISNFNDAVLNARSFLSKHEDNVQIIKFSTFTPGFAVGQFMIGDIPYYKINGTFYVSAVTVSFLYDIEQNLQCQYDIECSSSLYRDVYKTLFYSPKILSFDIGDSSGNINNKSYEIEIDIFVTFKTTISNIPTWEEVKGEQWSAIDGTTWIEFYRFSEGVTLTGNYTTEEIRNIFAQIAQGSFWDNSDEVETKKLVANLIMGKNHINLIGSGGNSYKTDVQETTPVTGTEFTSTYFITENDAKFHISNVNMFGFFPEGFGKVVTAMQIPVDIDKSPTNPQGQYAMTIGITVDFQ